GGGDFAPDYGQSATFGGVFLPFTTFHAPDRRLCLPEPRAVATVPAFHYGFLPVFCGGYKTC
ncbi:MAG TPA: hypothetical protein VFK45_06680, partial [Gammaproteobacteria bacterium]|nr:hypothetical protein [Gammaproteobacteria bacterium]